MVKINIYKRKKNSPQNPHNDTCQIWMDQWKIMSTWCDHYSCKLITLELHIIVPMYL